MLAIFAKYYPKLASSWEDKLRDAKLGDDERYFDGLPDDLSTSDIDFVASGVTDMKTKGKEFNEDFNIDRTRKILGGQCYELTGHV